MGNGTPFDPATCVTNEGVTMPRLADILAWLETQYKSVYGQDIDLDPESPDGQIVGIEAEMFADLGGLLQMAYDGIASPGKATGAMLGNICLLNGVTGRAGVATTTTLTIEGTPGTTITSSFIIKNKNNGALFSPTTTITVGAGGTGSGQVTCREIGPIEALAGDVSQIVTITTGIVSATNASNGSVGYCAESDSDLHARRYQSVALPSTGMTDGLQAAIINMRNVKQAIVWENDQDVAVSVGQSGTLPPHSVYVLVDVVAGSSVDPDSNTDPDPIATTIYQRKAGGCTTVGTVSKTVTDTQGNPHVIRYGKATTLPVYVEVNISTRYGWPTDGATQIADAIAAWSIDTDDNGNRNISIGGDSNHELSWTDVLSSFVSKVGGFNLTSMKLGTTLGGGTSGANLAIDYDEIATIIPANVNVVVS